MVTRTQWILQQRPARQRPTPGGQLLGQLDEWECAWPGNQLVRARTLFLRGSECRFHCTMCDLWQYTHTEHTRPGDIPQQIAQGLSDLDATQPQPLWLKLYNASNFFDSKCVPREDWPAIAELIRPMKRLIVENHPRLLTHDVLDAFCELLAACQLELAMGLETAHPEVLRKLNKQMTVGDFRRAVSVCLEHQVLVRAFVLLQTPWLDADSAMIWCQRTIDEARDMGVQHLSVIPVRGGNGAMEQLVQAGEFTPPSAAMLETILEKNLAHEDCLVTVDLWDWDKLRGKCAECSALRRDRLDQMNLYRQCLPAVTCTRCSVCEPRV